MLLHIYTFLVVHCMFAYVCSFKCVFFWAYSFMQTRRHRQCRSLHNNVGPMVADDMFSSVGFKRYHFCGTSWKLLDNLGKFDGHHGAASYVAMAGSSLPCWSTEATLTCDIKGPQKMATKKEIQKQIKTYKNKKEKDGIRHEDGLLRKQKQKDKCMNDQKSQRKKK